MVPLLTTVLTNLIITLIIELLVYFIYLLARHAKSHVSLSLIGRGTLIIFLVNCATNPIVNIIFNVAYNTGIQFPWTLVVFAALEFWVVITEGWTFKKFMPNELEVRPYVLSILANGATIILSIIMMTVSGTF